MLAPPTSLGGFMLVVCPNPTVDRQVLLGELLPGTVERARENQAFPAGKSVSAARGCLANGASPEVHVLLPRGGSAWYLQTLQDEGMDVTARLIPGVGRESIIVYEDSGRVTVLNGAGARVSAGEWEAFVAAVCDRIPPGGWVICSGSFPPGVGPEALVDLVTRVAKAGGKLALDTGPVWLPAALPARPWLITPNLAEAEAVLSGEADSEPVEVGAAALERAVKAAAALHARGIPEVVVTAGSAGAAWCTDDGSGRLAGLQVEVRNPIGAGDAFMGGLVSALERGEPFAAAVRWGMATACSAIEQWVPGGAVAERVGLHRARLGHA
ncbi:MAG: bifunctional hydroxymethylpyrimidine kinase/phosphomethylpyrimidine kinase [Propionibacteriaceae bacterium]|nr:bifunctional hydroxymethylpyrimidine kinase/phosphomethylpyrimidine kinase [Propionibacteriaceae bacterium]